MAEDEPRRNLNMLDHFHSRIKDKWQNMNTSFDNFFASETYEEETNESYIRFNFVFKWEEGGSDSAEYNFKLRTDFPNTSKRIKIIIEKESDRYDDQGVAPGSDFSQVPDDRSISEALEDNKYAISGRYSILKKRGWDIHSSLGLRAEVPLNPFLKARLRKRFTWGKHYLDAIFNAKYYRIEEIEHHSDLDYRHYISENTQIQFINRISYKHTDRFYSFSNSLALLKKYSDSHQVSYAIRASGESEPNYSYNDFSISANSRFLIYDKWLFAQFALGFDFPRDEDFREKLFSLWMLEAYF